MGRDWAVISSFLFFSPCHFWKLCFLPAPQPSALCLLSTVVFLPWNLQVAFSVSPTPWQRCVAAALLAVKGEDFGFFFPFDLWLAISTVPHPFLQWKARKSPAAVKIPGCAGASGLETDGFLYSRLNPALTTASKICSLFLHSAPFLLLDVLFSLPPLHPGSR